jgi:outer membrane autotransporter protein
MFRHIDQSRIVPGAGKVRLRGRNAVAVAGLALSLSLLAASGAQAQNCVIGPSTPVSNLGQIGASPASVSSVVASTLSTASTAFLLQSTAFIGSPPNPAPDQQGGGVWVRGVGGGVSVKSSSSTVVTANGAGLAAPQNTPVNCNQTIHENFAGVQLGTDIARLNSNGWNVHVGVTAGYLETWGRVDQGAFSSFDTTLGANVGGGAFNSTTQVPFVGAYAAATYGGFFVDGLVRAEYYQTSLNAPGVNLFNQNIDAHGFSFSGSLGYNWQIPNTTWFIEPSAGVILSRLTVDPFNFVTAGNPAGVGGTTFSGTLQLQDIKSEIGRVGLRVGTTINAGNVIWQPFAAVSVWHEFGPDATATYGTCVNKAGGPGCAFFGGAPLAITAATTTTNFGTFGQYSLGVAAQVAGTGWLGFARVDYRNGSNLEGLSATGGLRYQFTPDAIVKMPVKAPVYKAPIVEAVNWTGFYVGGFGGGILGRADWGFFSGSANPHVGGYILGGAIGYNYQSGQWVFGVEADLGKTNLTGGTACAPLASGTFVGGNAAPMFQMTCNAWANWIATATARVGYAWERALFYVKGGGAWTNEQISATCNLGPISAIQVPIGQACTNPAGAVTNGLVASTNLGGWTIGYGSEFALTRNWSARAEYNYISFGDRNVTASDGSVLNVGMHVSEVKVGLNYRFDYGPLAVSAKY